jgi:hypothetical protein
MISSEGDPSPGGASDSAGIRLKGVLAIFILAISGTLAWGATTALSASDFNFIDTVTIIASVDGSEVLVGSNGWTARDHIQVWRPAGYETELAYKDTSNHEIAVSTNTSSNPYYWSQSESYAEALCGNLSGSDVRPYTCQTTHP